MGRNKARLFGPRHGVERVGHLERSEDAPSEIVIKRQAGELLNDTAEPIRADAVDPLLTWLEQQRIGRIAGARLEIAKGRARKAVAEARGVREEVAHGN